MPARAGRPPCRRGRQVQVEDQQVRRGFADRLRRAASPRRHDVHAGVTAAFERVFDQLGDVGFVFDHQNRGAVLAQLMSTGRVAAPGFPACDMAVKCGLRWSDVTLTVTVSLLDFRPARVRGIRFSFFPARRTVFRALQQDGRRDPRRPPDLLEQMLAIDPPDVSTSSHQGRGASVRRADARHDSAPAPHVRHAVRSRRPVRAGVVARQRHGRDRPCRGARPALPDHEGSARRPRTGAHGDRHRPTRLHDGARGAGGARQPVQPHAVEINRLENEADRAYQNARADACSTPRPIRS